MATEHIEHPGPLGSKALTPETLSAARAKGDTKAAKAAAAQARPDAISALLAQGEALLDPAAVAAVKTRYESWLAGLEQRMRDEDALLTQLQDLHRTHRSLKDQRWCNEDPDGRKISKQVADLHRALDALYGAKPTDPDYPIIRAMRSGWTYGDYADAIYLCCQELPKGGESILCSIMPDEQRRLRRRGVMEDFFFHLGGKTYFPNGYEGRTEVRRVVGFLFGMRFRGLRSLEIERKRQPELLTEHPVGADIGLVVSRDVNYQLSGPIEFAAFIDGLVFPRPGQTTTRKWTGVVHLAVEPAEYKGAPIKVVRVLESSGDISRILEPGKRWGAFLKQDPKQLATGSHGVRTKMPDALLSYIEQHAGNPEHLGLAAWQRHEDEWKERKGGKRKDAPKPPSGTGEQPAAAAESSEDKAPAVEAPAATKKRVRKPRASASGNNGTEGPAEPVPPAAS